MVSVCVLVNRISAVQMTESIAITGLKPVRFTATVVLIKAVLMIECI